MPRILGINPICQRGIISCFLSSQRPQRPCNNRKPCIHGTQDLLRRTEGKQQGWWAPQASIRWSVFSFFSNEKPSSLELPFCLPPDTSLLTSILLYVFFIFSFVRAASEAEQISGRFPYRHNRIFPRSDFCRISDKDPCNPLGIGI